MNHAPSVRAGSGAELDIRQLAAHIEIRTDGTARKITGYGAVFNQETVIAGMFREVILPGAFADSLRDEDIVVSFNHNADYVLGRVSSGTAAVDEDSKGLRYEVPINDDDPDHIRVAAKVSRRDVKGSSFMFRVENDADEEWKRDDPAKLPLRIIKRVRLFELGPVVWPAYPGTSVSARTMDRFKEWREVNEQDERIAPAEVPDPELAARRREADRLRFELAVAAVEI